MRAWIKEELDYLKENANKMTDKEIAEELNRSISSVKTKRKKMRYINPNPYHKKYTFDDVVINFSKTDYILLSGPEDYINSAENTIRYLCPRHLDKGELTISLYHLLEGKGCKYCGRKIIEEAHIIELDKSSDKELCESKGFVYLDTVRKDGKINILFLCPEHEELGEQFMTRYNMQRDIKGCKYCCGKDLPDWYVLNQLKEINPYIELLEPYEKLTKSIKYLCTKHDIQSQSTIQNLLKGQGCEICGREKLSVLQTISSEEVQRRVSERNPHVKLLQYNGNELSLWYCNKHNKTFTKRSYQLYNCDSGCDICYRENLRKNQGMGQEEFEKRLNVVHPELKVLGKYINNNTNLRIYCQKHDYLFNDTPTAALNRLVCCSKSRTTYKEEQVCKLLEKWGYIIERQKEFEDCKDIRNLAFDIYIPEYNIVIEYQGEQHYRPVSYGKETKEEAELKLKYTQSHDKIKKDYCKKRKIKLIEVPYWEYEDLDFFMFDQLVKNGAIIENQIVS